MENLRGAALMTFSMLGFAIEDVLIKVMSADMPPGQIIASLSGGAALVFLIWFLLRGEPVFTPHHLSAKVLLRTGFEMVGSMLFVTALIHLGVTLLSAIIQATPLVVALGGALFLGQHVGWRRWIAIGVGFGGVLLILRPGGADFSIYLLMGVLAMLCLAGRDLVTRALHQPITGTHLAFHAFLGLGVAGILLCILQGTPMIMPTAGQAALLVLAVCAALLAYLTIVAATRSGDAAFISSFRYSRMVFALGLGMTVLGERPDALTLLGVIIVIAAGLFTLIREARLQRASQTSPEPL